LENCIYCPVIVSLEGIKVQKNGSRGTVFNMKESEEGNGRGIIGQTNNMGNKPIQEKGR
jgi:hypothetical protein